MPSQGSQDLSAAAGLPAGQRRLVQQMNPQDNVATALVELTPGMVVTLPGSGGTAGALEVIVSGTVSFGHKVALAQIAAGAPVLKYGEVIGLASADIHAGDHVHTHNVDSQRGRGDLHK